MKTRLLIFAGLLIAGSSEVFSRNWPVNSTGTSGNPPNNGKLAAGCAPGAGRTDLDLNNVRTTIYTTGDMWWDLISAPRYEVPKGSRKHSAFAGSLWLAGLDNGGNLKSAAMMYRQNGNDFWPGPLKLDDASTAPEVCLAYDRHWKITRREVEDFVLGGLPATDVINSWPGNGISDLGLTGYASEIAPFVDGDGDGVYDPTARDENNVPIDFPGYDIYGDLGCKARLFGDQTLWYIFNDKGNIHTETAGFPIGFEIRAQAFQFATNNALNNMTFYNYEIINRSTFTVSQTYFGQWTDPDLGNYADDYAGCDVGRGMGYVYNGDADDETVLGYGLNPPAIGIDFFEGPFEDANSKDDTSDFCVNPRARNGLGYGDGIIDNERIGMARFSYFNSGSNPVNGDPQTGQQIYNYLRGFWKDGTDMTYGNDGIGGNVKYSFMFPGNTDPEGLGEMIANGTVNQCRQPNEYLPNWDEPSLGLAPADRRLVQSAGPFTLEPGAVNKVTVGVVWARASSGGPLASVELVKRVDDDAQALFDNCFSLINGPDAPQTRIVELDKELIFLFENTYNDDVVYYQDNTSVPGFGDVTYRFQGYQVFQLKDLSVTVNDLKDPSRARLVAQCDLQDNVDQIVNRYFDQTIEENVPVEEVNGENKGLRNSFQIKRDAFATGDNRLVNHKQYYYLVLSYAAADIDTVTFGLRYLAGRRTKGFSALQIYTAIPHISAPSFNGTEIQSKYGEIPSLTRIEGQGNGSNSVDLTEESIAEILQAPFWVKNPTYKRNSGPVNIKVVDPLSITDSEYEFKILGLNDTSRWSLRRLSDNSTYTSSGTLSQGIEEVISQWGFAVDVKQVLAPGLDKTGGNGFIEGSITYADNSKRWLNFLVDEEGCNNPANWIRSGNLDNPPASNLIECNDYIGVDNGQYYERILGGTWAPFQLVSRYDDGPCYENASAQAAGYLQRLGSVDIVLTPDQTKWSRCPVFETNDDKNFSQGNADKLLLRNAPSVGKDGKPDGDGTGMGWFPGYAINVATGERLNIAFGESSRLTQDNGRDMIFNPSQRVVSFGSTNLIWNMGGKHFIYVFNHVNTISNNEMPLYDGGEYIRQTLSTPNISNNVKLRVWAACNWVAIPLSVSNQPWLSNEVKIRLRVTRPYAENYAQNTPETGTVENNNLPMYRFKTADMFARKQEKSVAESALNTINVVPNPYYAYSAYEVNQLDNRVKIINLPSKCQVKIYTTNGTLVRTYQKDDRLTSLDWDMKNQAGITISSGVYLIHIKVDGVGERVLKWFGVLRPIDLDSF